MCCRKDCALPHTFRCLPEACFRAAPRASYSFPSSAPGPGTQPGSSPRHLVLEHLQPSPSRAPRGSPPGARTPAACPSFYASRDAAAPNYPRAHPRSARRDSPPGCTGCPEQLGEGQAGARLEGAKRQHVRRDPGQHVCTRVCVRARVCVGGWRAHADPGGASLTPGGGGGWGTRSSPSRTPGRGRAGTHTNAW